MSLSAKVICLIACHGGSADHFTTFAENLIQEGYEVQVYASNLVVKKFQDRNIRAIPFALEGLSSVEESVLADQIAKSCRHVSVVLTDVGHSFDEKLQKSLKDKAPNVLRLSYYDNPEPEVPGGYSAVAAKVMKASQGVLFANANLATIPLYQGSGRKTHVSVNKRVGIGYYPLAQAEKIVNRRKEERDLVRDLFLKKQGLSENGQKILVYFGGNNEEYFTKAFPAFLDFLSQTMQTHDLSNHVIVLQQHPAAKISGRDQALLTERLKKQGEDSKAPQIILSQESTEDMQVVADAALYYQTSMGPVFALAGIPTIQVAHKTYPDVLVRGKLCPSVTNASDFANAIDQLRTQELSEETRREIFESLGLQKEWFSILKNALLQERTNAGMVQFKNVGKSVLSNKLKTAWNSFYSSGVILYQKIREPQIETSPVIESERKDLSNT